VKASAYTPFGQSFLSGWGTLHVRFDGPAAAMIPRVRDAMRAVDAQLPIYDVETLSGAVDRHLSEQRLLSNTIAGFAVVATLIAALGLYGVLARGVAERRREFSIRTALGAGPMTVAGLITREAMTVTLCGGVVGMTAAWMLAQSIQARLFGVQALDAVSLGGALAIVICTALASALAPARQAGRVDVATELR
jgi:ABC-type antimicrobial peptide transport system permease subunit